MRTITMQEMMSLKNITILDVREEDEYEDGIIPHAILMPLSTIHLTYDKLDKSVEYYVVCYSGSRSLMAAQALDRAGYKMVNVLGGMSAYTGRLEYEM